MTGKENDNRLFLGIDPGTAIVGFGLVRSTGNQLSSAAYGIIDGKGLEKTAQFRNVRKSLTDILEKYHPVAVAVEKLFFFKNQKTVMAVSEMRGVILETLSEKNIPVYEITPLQVKQTICNYGRAEKKQVQHMVKLLLRLQEDVRQDDAADALALAVCCSALHKE